MYSSNRAPLASLASLRKSAFSLVHTLILGSIFSAALGSLATLLTLTALTPATRAQSVTAELDGTVTDPSGAVVAKANITATNSSNGFSRTVQSGDDGRFILAGLPPGTYKVTVEHEGFTKVEKDVTLQIDQHAFLDFALAVGAAQTQVTVTATTEVTEPTRTQVSTVVTENQINELPVNGREFIDFALLAPGVQIGDTTSGSTDVIVEPVTKLSFAGQNIHFNFIAVDGADDISTVSGIQRGTPPQDSVQEFRVVNTDYTTEFGRAVGGIVNIITKSGTNDFHGSAYEYFQNNALDADSVLAAPGLNVVRQNQFGLDAGGPIIRDKMFFFANYEGQRRGESPHYNSAVLDNIGAINNAKVALGLPAETLDVLRTSNIDNGFLRWDANLGQHSYLFTRYFVTDARLTNQSPLNDGFDLPSSFKDNFFRDQSLAAQLTSTFGNKTNELRGQFARRSFDFPTDSTQPHLEVSNTFATGVNRGNPDFYREHRAEIDDTFTWNLGRHTISFGGDFNFVRSQETFPLFYPFEADFANLGAFLGNDGVVTACPTAPVCPHPFVIFFERFDKAADFREPHIDTSVYQGRRIPAAIDKQATGLIDHTYEGFFVQEKFRATQKLNINAGLRYDFETWPSDLLHTYFGSVDPRLGIAYNLGTKEHFVIRAGAGLFHGTIPSPLLGCQIPSCGGQAPYPGTHEDAANSNTELFAFASAPGITNVGLESLLLGGTYPDAVPFPNVCFPGETTLSQCGFFGTATIVRFDELHKNPYGAQASLSVEFEPAPNTAVDISYQHIRGVHLGSFYNVNQPDPSGQFLVHDTGGGTGCKDVYFAFAPGDPNAGKCAPIPAEIPAGAVNPGVRNPNYAVFFEATSRWDSQFDGMFITVNRRVGHHIGFGLSYTFAKSIDDGPNPSFVLIPQDSDNLREERALSADDVRHRFVGNLTLTAPKNGEAFLRDWEFSTVVTLQSPQHFTKFAGFDANGDVFGNNDRVGIEGRNTFEGDSLQTVDVRLSRIFPLNERMNLQLMAEAFNLMNTVNVRFFNTTYGAADFCPEGGPNAGCTGTSFIGGSPNPLYGTPRAVFNPRQLQLAVRFNF